MSWLFGRNKKEQKDLPSDSTEEEQTSDSSEGFVDVSSWQSSKPSNIGQDTNSHPSGNLYPYVPPMGDYGRVPSTDSSKDFNYGDGAHCLNGVPFKLCKRLEACVKNDFEIEKLRISEMLSFIERIESHNYDYSFSLEEGVAAEMNSASGQ